MESYHTSGRKSLDAYKEVQKIFKEVYHEELDESHPLVEDYIQTEFEKEQQITNIVSIFAFITILISTSRTHRHVNLLHTTA